MKIAIAQINTKIGDIDYNRDIILENIRLAKDKGCSLICFPELALTGYPPCDLLYNPLFIARCNRALEEIVKAASGVDVILGTVVEDLPSGKLKNSAVLIKAGAVYTSFAKSTLNSYPYFDENRYFVEGKHKWHLVEYGDKRLGIVIGNIQQMQICTAHTSGLQNVDLIINMSATPYYYGRQTKRIDCVSKVAKSLEIPIIFINMVGGNNDLVFDGGSFIISRKGKVCTKASSFKESFFVWDIGDDKKEYVIDEDISYLYKGIVLGLRDYCKKLGVRDILLGLSGGVDSALAACIAADAVGNTNVLAVPNHSEYTTKESRVDADSLIANLGVKSRNIPIDNLFKAYIDEFNDDGKPIYDLAEENIQARIRGDIWMFISNREGHMVISASNKSELNIGYTTLYGDMCSGMAPLSDIYKTQVYDLCRYINSEEEIIPESIITKPPSAELRPGQRDEDSLPPYAILDKVLYLYLEEGLFEEEIIAHGYDEDVVYRIINMVKTSEYKRRQAALPIRISKGWFKRGRFMPVVHGFRPK